MPGPMRGDMSLLTELEPAHEPVGYEHVAPQAPFMVAIAAVLPSALLTLIFVREPEKREE